ncbi:MAG: ABC transporter permease [Hyphomicrobiaceae bacterium]|nr:MAG: ABC transporter permease [Hyphomicrobiaceae bacterium]
MRFLASSILRRVAHAVPALIGIALIAFVLLSLAPGDLVDILAADGAVQDDVTAAQLRAQYGLDQPVIVQALYYLRDVARLDLGFSPIHGLPVADLIFDRLPATILLMMSSILLAVIVGVSLGLISGRNVNTWRDVVASVFAALFFAAPSFWVGLMLMVGFSIKLGWLPVSGMVTIGADYGPLGRVLDTCTHLVLPTAALGLFYAAIYARVMRSAVLQVSVMDFVETARAKGVPERAITLRHVLGNAILPVVTLVGLQMGTVLAGSVVIEQVFSWPGVGTLLFDAVMARNLSIVMGVLILGSILVVISNLVIDILYYWLDPRIQIQ